MAGGDLHGHDPVRFDLFANGHPQSGELVRQWHARAKEPNRGVHESFGKFTELWFGFNNWAMRVTESDTDANMIRALAKSPALIDAFENLRARDEQFREHALRFAKYWPIFDVKDLRKKGLRYKFYELNRLAYARELIAANVKHAPQGCFDPASPEWSSTIQAAYKVRCNLFHGEKGDALDDLDIVDSAFRTLLGFIDGVDLYLWNGPNGVAHRNNT